LTLDFNDRLTNILEQRRLKGKLEQDLRAVEEELSDQSARLESLSLKLEKEKVDVEKLERTNLIALFYAVLGSREQQLEKERQELLSAQLSYQQCKHQVDYLDRERDRILHQLDKLQGIDLEYASLISEKEQYLRQSNQPVASELMALSEQIAHLNTELKEIAEALAAGNEAISSLEQVISALESAEGWGTWDLLGGGLISTAIKHSRIDEARSSIHEVETTMSRFRRELSDVQQSVDLQINIGEFESFADFFFDGLIVDWIVQSKIVDSLERCRQVKGKIAKAVKELEYLRQSVQSQARDAEEKRALLIERT
jgi:DNA repair exonuclease SbcCD ATPase subunit